jgi:hypothetical protein
MIQTPESFYRQVGKLPLVRLIGYVARQGYDRLAQLIAQRLQSGNVNIANDGAPSIGDIPFGCSQSQARRPASNECHGVVESTHVFLLLLLLHEAMTRIKCS